MSCENRVSILLNEITEGIADFKTVNEIRLFGSQVSLMNEESDVDLLFLCINRDEYDELLAYLYKISLKYKILIHPVIKDCGLDTIMNNEFMRKNVIENSVVLYQR